MMNHHWWYFVKNWYRKMYSHSVPVKPVNFFGGNWQLNIDLLESKHLFLSFQDFQDLKKMSKNAQTSFCVSDSICTCFRLWIARRFDNLKFRVNNIVLRLSWKSFRSGDISWIYFSDGPSFYKSSSAVCKSLNIMCQVSFKLYDFPAGNVEE